MGGKIDFVGTLSDTFYEAKPYYGAANSSMELLD